MTAIIAPTIVRYSFHWGLNNGKVGATIMDISYDSGVAGNRAAELPAFSAKVQDLFQDKIAAVVMKPVTYSGCDWHDLDSLSTTNGSMAPNGSKPVNNGSTSSNVAPVQVCILVTKNCTHTRKQRKGRCFLPGVNSAAIDNVGALGTSYQSTIQTAFDQWRSGVPGLADSLVPGASSALRVVHKKSPTEWESSDITSFTVQPWVATQRDRSHY